MWIKMQKPARPREERKSCRIRGKMRYFQQTMDVGILNLSRGGLSLQTPMPFGVPTGSKVRIETEELGAFDGIVRWRRDGRFGIEFDPNSNARARTEAYFRFFHKEVRPVLTR